MQANVVFERVGCWMFVFTISGRSQQTLSQDRLVLNKALEEGRLGNLSKGSLVTHGRRFQALTLVTFIALMASYMPKSENSDTSQTPGGTLFERQAKSCVRRLGACIGR